MLKAHGDRGVCVSSKARSVHARTGCLASTWACTQRRTVALCYPQQLTDFRTEQSRFHCLPCQHRWPLFCATVREVITTTTKTPVHQLPGHIQESPSKLNQANTKLTSPPPSHAQPFPLQSPPGVHIDLDGPPPSSLHPPSRQSWLFIDSVHK